MPLSPVSQPALYRHTPPACVSIALFGVAIAATLWCAVHGQPACLALAVPMTIGLQLFTTLTVIVEDAAVFLSFGTGVIHRRIPLDRVRDARTVRNRWYYGWGSRWTPHGWLWNLSGLDAVELTYEDGGRFRIGTDEPDRLVDALRAPSRRATGHI